MSRRAEDAMRISSGVAMVLAEAASKSRLAQSLFQQDPAKLAEMLARHVAPAAKSAPQAEAEFAAPTAEAPPPPRSPAVKPDAVLSSSRPSLLRSNGSQLTFTASAMPAHGAARAATRAREAPRMPTATEPKLQSQAAKNTYTPHVAGAPREAVQLPPAQPATPPPLRAHAADDTASKHSERPLGTTDAPSTQPPARPGSIAADLGVPQQPLVEPLRTASDPRTLPPHATRTAAAAAPPQEAAPAVPKRKFRERAVPSSRVSRALGFAGLGAGLAWGAATDAVSRAFTPADPSGKPRAALSEGNARRLASALCRMRGAALKIGQMLSIQDEDLMPPQVAAALEQVRQSADVMPRWQLERTLEEELGTDWATRVAHFDWEPAAAASIGQVHKARLHDGRTVAMKIQYPGVATSIESDVDNLVNLMSVFNVLPRGLFIDEAVAVAKQELALECDYRHEARCQHEYYERLQASPALRGVFEAPELVPELSARRVITGTWLPGVAIDKVKELDQATRDRVGTALLSLTLQELYAWRFMQTDPNFGNFLYDEGSGRIKLIDFGAARHFPKTFVDHYLRMVKACADEDRAEIIRRSVSLGFLTGEESEVMLDAHVRAGATVGTPFGTRGVYDFGAHGQLTRRVSELGAKMLQHRLTAPPVEAYSLHRRLSGAFLANIRLRARVPCKQLFDDVYAAYDFDGADDPAMQFTAPVSPPRVVPPPPPPAGQPLATNMV